MTSKTVPKLQDYHVSEEFGFLLPEALSKLPERFEAWNELNRKFVDLLTNRKLREEVDKMPLLDDSQLNGYRELRLAYMYLCFIGSGYIWQDGDQNLPKVIPKQLAIPWYSVSKRLGLKPVMCQAAMTLSNYTRPDPTKPLSIGNAKRICSFPGGEISEWFTLVLIQEELDAAPGIKALVQAMEAVLNGNDEAISSALETITLTFRTMKTTASRMHEKLTGDVFFNKILPLLSGWGGAGSKVPEGIVFEGASDTPVIVGGGSAAQSSTLQSFDAGLGLDHKQDHLTELRDYMPPSHADFIRALEKGPSIKNYVTSSSNSKLKDAYKDCVSALKDFRTYHLQLITKFILIPAREKTIDPATEKGLGDIMQYLKNIRDTTSSDH